MDAFLKTGKLGSGSSMSFPTSKQKSISEQKRRPIPWVEKYRPRSIEEVVYQDEVVSILRKTLQGADFPNLLFYGPPGTGKTSTILAVARELFDDLYKQRTMELNASDERGIRVIREKVKAFAQTSVSGTKPNGQPCPPFKIVILDEADSMTSAAQAALRRTMEKESKNTRFCLLCNYVSRIIDPLTSRCSKFRFKPLSDDVMLKHLSYICKEESVEYEEGTLECLIDNCEGDLRKAITSLQSVSRLMSGEKVTKENINEITGVIPEKVLQELMEISHSDSYDKLEDFINSLILDGYSAIQLINQLHDTIIFNQELSEQQKSTLLKKLAICDHSLCDGADEYLQIMDLCCIMMSVLCRH